MFIFLIIGIFIMAILYMLNIGIEYKVGRLSIFGENSNKIGIFAVIAIFFILSLVIENKQQLSVNRFWFLLFLLPLFKIIAETGSRVTFIGLMFSLVVFFTIQKRRKVINKFLIKALGVVAIVLVFYYLMSNELLQERMQNTVERGDLAGRDYIWRTILPPVLDNLFLGIGANGYSSLSYNAFGTFYSPHNVFIEIMAYSGLIGLFTFLLFYYKLTKTAWQINKDHSYILPIVMLLFIFLNFFTGQGLGVKLFWVVYAYILSVYLNYNINIAETETTKTGVSEMVNKPGT
jgi:O-antigen ligase